MQLVLKMAEIKDNGLGRLKVTLKDPGDGREFYIQLGNTGELVPAADATIFTARKYRGQSAKDLPDAFFFRVTNSDFYLDQGLANGVLYSNKPIISTDLSSIWAWRLTGGELEAVAVADKYGLQKLCAFAIPNIEVPAIRCLFTQKLAVNEQIANVEWQVV